MHVTRTKILAFVASLAVVAAAAFVIHVLAAPRPTAKPSQPAVAVQAPSANAEKVPVLYFAKDPEAAPPFLVRDLSGNVVSTAALKGKVVLLNFWATWCGP
ncbi:MAG TPA: TlpA disulfide reductase family protein, partial [Candidatus Dormibacteraeota bacterium]|nr:TlpA disulfide reductase family protein [Candidatus Dormibacteraeota bacterium]